MGALAEWGRALMRVLVACEFSARVRDAFRARGHDAWSCDLIPTEGDPRYHFCADVLHVIGPHWTSLPYDRMHKRRWDLLIAFPPCTYLCNSGVRWLEGGRNLNRWLLMQEAARFFRRLFVANVNHIAVENPVMHGYALDIIERHPSFTIQPWQFGEPEKKRTCFWTKNLPPLVPTNVLDRRFALPKAHFASPGPNRWKERSRTLHGIAAAMADQWGAYVSKALKEAA